MTKQELLDTGYFIDNEYLDQYLLLVRENDTTKYTEKHHILQRAYFKLINKSCDNSASNLVKLSYFNHCKAHFLLANCTIAELRHNNLATLRLMTASKRAKFNYLSEEELQTVKIYNDNNDLFWNETENNLLRQYYPKLGTACIKYLPDRTKRAIKCQAQKLGILFEFENSEKKRFTKAEDKFLIENYNKFGVAKCAKILNRSKFAIKSRARKVLKIAKEAPDPWAIDEIEILKQLYPIYGAKGIQKYLPKRNALAIRKKAKRLGIK